MKKIKANYKIGDKIKMTDDALDNYGAKYRDKVFTVEHVAVNHEQHPGFDGCAGSALYDFEGFNNSLYEWEMKKA